MKKSLFALFTLVTLISSAFAAENVLILNPANQRITFDRREIQVDGATVGKFGVLTSDVLTLKQALVSAKAMGKLVKLSAIKSGDFSKIDMIDIEKSDELVRCESENAFLKELITHQMTSGVQSNRSPYSPEAVGLPLPVKEATNVR